METNSVNKETITETGIPVSVQQSHKELPWQDISTLKDSDWEGDIIVWTRKAKTWIWNWGTTVSLTLVGSDYLDGTLSHWLPITRPQTTTVEAPPVEPERVSVQEFAKNPVGKWVLISGCYDLFCEENRGDLWLRLKIIEAGNPIYATKPTAWLEWKAEQELKSIQ